MSWHLRLSALVPLALVLSGCASSSPEESNRLETARTSFHAVKEDPDVLRSAPKDVIRAGESLARADRLSSYWGSAEDVSHYAYLSQRYSDIAHKQTEKTPRVDRDVKWEQYREALEVAVREAKLQSVQEQSNWLEEQMLSLSTSETERGLVMTLGDVLFDAARAELKASANRTVLKLAQFMQLNPRRTVRIEGYTDNRGDKQENLELSRARAQTVADLLVDLGVDGKRIEVAGHGEDFPIAENASARGRAQNRRVEIVFSDEQGRLGAAR